MLTVSLRMIDGMLVASKLELGSLEVEHDGERFPIDLPGLGLVWIVQLRPVQPQHIVEDEAGVEPEVKGTILVGFGHRSALAIELESDIAGQRPTVDRCHD